MQVGKTKDQGLYNKPSAAVHPGALVAGTLPQYNTITFPKFCCPPRIRREHTNIPNQFPIASSITIPTTVKATHKYCGRLSEYELNNYLQYTVKLVYFELT